MYHVVTTEIGEVRRDPLPKPEKWGRDQLAHLRASEDRHSGLFGFGAKVGLGALTLEIGLRVSGGCLRGGPQTARQEPRTHDVVRKVKTPRDDDVLTAVVGFFWEARARRRSGDDGSLPARRLGGRRRRERSREVARLLDRFAEGGFPVEALEHRCEQRLRCRAVGLDEVERLR
jgi:hypothetical protein